MIYNHNCIRLLPNPNGSPILVKVTADTEEGLFDEFVRRGVCMHHGNFKENILMFKIKLEYGRIYTVIANDYKKKGIKNDSIIILGEDHVNGTKDIICGRDVIITSGMTNENHFKRNGLTEEDMNIILFNTEYTVHKGVLSLSLCLEHVEAIPYKLLEDE
jgi:hypothetical protein